MVCVSVCRNLVIFEKCRAVSHYPKFENFLELCETYIARLANDKASDGTLLTLH